MSETVSESSVLVMSDAKADAVDVANQLRAYFANVHTSTDEDTAAADFENARPAVLVMAFKSLEHAERRYLGLYRLSKSVVQSTHRTVLLCTKDDVTAAFGLCVKGHFDDYVLYWPQSFDGLRLPMTVWNACRMVGEATVTGLGTAELLTHAKSLGDVERVVADVQIDSASEMRKQLQPALAGTRPLAQAARLVKPVIMVIDDDEFTRRLLKQVLDPARWSVVMATGGDDAFAQLRLQLPDVILMDIHLPGRDGVALTRELKSSIRFARIPIVMMTGDSRRETLSESLQAGAAGFVVKPISRAALETNLGKLFPR